MAWLMAHTFKFPKHERFRLAKWAEEALRAFHECLIRAVYSDEPKPHLYEADIQLKLLRVYLRLSMELKYTSYNQYGYAAQLTTELGKLLGGWLKQA